jgi:calcineurin-like phosphoesterase family protein
VSCSNAKKGEIVDKGGEVNPPLSNGNDIWIGSDLHFGHHQLVGIAGRPEDFIDRIFNNYLNTPWKSGDTLILLGDFALYPKGQQDGGEFMESIKDRGVHRLLVKGNHDPKSMWRCQRMGFDIALDAARITFGGRDWYFTHEPVGVLGSTINVHGHLHELDGHRGKLNPDESVTVLNKDGTYTTFGGKHILISSELMDYRPIKLDRLLSIGHTPVWRKGRFERYGTDDFNKTKRAEDAKRTASSGEGSDSGGTTSV